MNDIEWRNLQQQVLKNKKDILKILQSLGAALPEPIPGPQGPQGERGLTGEDGDRGSGWIGLGSEVPSNSLGKNGDFFLRSNGMVYHKFQNTWQPQFTIKGANGLPGCNVPVEANPDAPSSAVLTKIAINGIVYTFTLEDYYTEGNGIEINQDEISVAIGEGLKFDEYFKVAINFEEVQEHLEPGNGIKIENGVISFDSDSEPGVQVVNGKSGVVELKALDIKANNESSIQANLERIDERIDDFVEDNIEGSATVVVDLNEQGTKYQVRLDNDYKNKIDKALQIPSSTPTEKRIVAVDTGNQQIQIKLGEGLSLEGSTSPFTLKSQGGIKIYEHFITQGSKQCKIYSTSSTSYSFDINGIIINSGKVLSCMVKTSQGYWFGGLFVESASHDPSGNIQIAGISYSNRTSLLFTSFNDGYGTDYVTEL